MTKTRIERDSMGELQVPVDALYGAQTQRAVDNFPISGKPMPCLLYTSPSPRDRQKSRMPSSA